MGGTDKLLEIYLDDDEIESGDHNSHTHEGEAGHTCGVADRRMHGDEDRVGAGASHAFHACACRVPGACGQHMDLELVAVACRHPPPPRHPFQRGSFHCAYRPRAHSIVFLP